MADASEDVDMDTSELYEWEPSDGDTPTPDDPADLSVFGPSALESTLLPMLNRGNPDAARKLLILTGLSNPKRFGIRNLIETLGAKQQCLYLLNHKPRNDSTVCWLCGYTVKQFGDFLISKSLPAWSNARSTLAGSLNAPECEHLLPVSAAMLYFTVLQKKSDVSEYYALNYDWAHKHCNGTKLDGLFMNIRTSKTDILKQPTINQDYISAYLNKLVKNSTFAEFVKSKGAIETWKKTRLVSITKQLTPLQESISKLGGFSALLSAAHIIDEIDSYYDTLIEKLSNPEPITKTQLMPNADILALVRQQEELYKTHGRGRKTFRRKRNGKSVRKATVRRNVAASNSDRKIRASIRKRS